MDAGGAASRLAAVRERIRLAARDAGRAPDAVTLVGITKTRSVEAAREIVDLGVHNLGENRVAELVAKREQLPDVTWHLVGQLQRNKVRDVVDGNVLIHSLDRPRLADAIQARASQRHLVQPVLVQVNVGADPAKGGCGVPETEQLVAYAQGLPNVEVRGLMTVPPLPSPGQDPVTVARAHFATLRGLRDEIVSTDPTVRELSMGMSADLEAAVAEGATMVRIGTDLFGPRPDPMHDLEEWR
ncbi:MAG: YggS family pyridoxal phosphate-dependent enzyme [Nitriliruptoraceae bacterium]